MMLKRNHVRSGTTGKGITVATLLLALPMVPAMAQTAATPAAPAATPAPSVRMAHGGPGMRHPGMFAGMSPEGRRMMVESMKAFSNAQDRSALKAARDRVNQAVAADRFDPAALAKAMDDERRIVDGQHARRQQALIAALQKLSPEDRKAFAKASQMGRERMSNMMKHRREMRGGDRRMPSPPPANPAN